MWLVPSGSRAPAGGGQSGRTSHGGTSRGGGRPNGRVQSAPGAEGLEGHPHRGGHHWGAAAPVAGAGTISSMTGIQEYCRISEPIGLSTDQIHSRILEIRGLLNLPQQRLTAPCISECRLYSQYQCNSLRPEPSSLRAECRALSPEPFCHDTGSGAL